MHKARRALLERKDGLATRQALDFAFEVRATSEDGTIEGYGSVFGVKDSYADVIERGAFKATLAAHKADGSMPALLWQHECDEPIGVWEEMSEDAKGLNVRGRLCLDTAQGKEAHALLKMGAIKGLSIGFIAKEWSYDVESDVRTLTAIDLWEVSLVTFPANRSATVTAVKSIESVLTIRDAEQLLRDRGFSKTEAVALVAKIKGLKAGDPPQSGGPGDPVAELVAALKRRGSAFA